MPQSIKTMVVVGRARKKHPYPQKKLFVKQNSFMLTKKTLELVNFTSGTQHTTVQKKKFHVAQKKFRFSDVWGLKPSYWRVVGVTFVFMISNYSAAFMILEAKNQGISSMNIPLVMVLQNVISMFEPNCTWSIQI